MKKVAVQLKSGIRNPRGLEPETPRNNMGNIRMSHTVSLYLSFILD